MVLGLIFYFHMPITSYSLTWWVLRFDLILLIGLLLLLDSFLEVQAKRRCLLAAGLIIEILERWSGRSLLSTTLNLWLLLALLLNCDVGRLELIID